MTRTNNFDGLRIIAASMVIIGHAYAITGTQGGIVIWQTYISTNFTASGAWDLSYIHSFIATPSIFALFYCMSYFGIGGMIFIAERYSLKTKTTIALIAGAILLQIDSSHLLAVTNFILIAFIVISVGQASWPVLRDLGRWGDLSYGTYVYGWSVAQVLALYFLDDFGVGWHIILALLISYVFGFFSWHLVEKRALRLKPKKAVEPAQTN